MNEKMDSVRDKKSALHRRIIHKALSHPKDSTLRSHTPLSKEIAFAKSVIIPNPIHQKTQRKTKERRKVVKQLVDELNNPSFEDVVKIFAATFNPDGKTRDLNNRSEYKRNVSIYNERKRINIAKRAKVSFIRIVSRLNLHELSSPSRNLYMTGSGNNLFTSINLINDIII